MNGIKKINLLPPEIRSKYANRYLKYMAFSAFVVMALAFCLQLAGMGILKLQIHHYQEQNAQYEQEKRNIEEIQNRIVSYNEFIDEYETGVFPFAQFMNDVENIRPESVYIISVDTPDRLINEGKKEEEKPEETKEPVKEDSKDSETEKDGLVEIEDLIKPEIKYVDDLVGKDIIIRGYGRKQEDISAFIYELSKIPYINNAKITAIEEHSMLDGNKYNIFEIVVQGGTYIENNNEG